MNTDPSTVVLLQIPFNGERPPIDIDKHPGLLRYYEPVEIPKQQRFNVPTALVDAKFREYLKKKEMELVDGKPVDKFEGFTVEQLEARVIPDHSLNDFVSFTVHKNSFHDNSLRKYSHEYLRELGNYIAELVRNSPNAGNYVNYVTAHDCLFIIYNPYFRYNNTQNYKIQDIDYNNNHYYANH